MKSSFQLASVALSAVVGLYTAFIIVCLTPQKSEIPAPGDTVAVAMVNSADGERQAKNQSANGEQKGANFEVSATNSEQIRQDKPSVEKREVRKEIAQNNAQTVAHSNPAPVIDPILDMSVGPIDPDVPSMPDVPSVPETPAAPAVPPVPETPAAPAAPSVPDPPAAPVAPSVPEPPAAPVVPSVPEVPAIPAEPSPAIGTDSAAVTQTPRQAPDSAASPEPRKSKATLINDNLPGTFSMPTAPEIDSADEQAEQNIEEKNVEDKSDSSPQDAHSSQGASHSDVVQTSAIEPTQQSEIPATVSQPSFEASEAAVVSDARVDHLDPMAPMPPGLFSDVKLTQGGGADSEIRFGERSFVPRYVIENRRAKAFDARNQAQNNVAAIKAPHSGAIGMNVSSEYKIQKKSANDSKEPVVDFTNGFHFDSRGEIDIRKAFSLISAKFPITIILSANVSGTLRSKADSQDQAEFLEQVLDGTEFFVKIHKNLAYIGNRKDLENVGEEFGKISAKKFMVKESDKQVLEWLIVPQLTRAGKVLSRTTEGEHWVLEIQDYQGNLFEIERLYNLYMQTNVDAKISAVSLEYVPQDGEPFTWSKLAASGEMPYSAIEGISEERAVVINKSVSKFNEQLSKMENIIPLATASQVLSSNLKAPASSLSIRPTVVQNYPGNWNALPQQIGFVARIENSKVVLNLALPTNDPEKPEGLMFTISDSEILSMVIPMTVMPLDPGVALGFIPKVWEKKPAPIQKYVLLVFAVENTASMQAESSLSASGRMYWSTYFTLQSKNADKHLSQDQKAFYAKMSKTLKKDVTAAGLTIETPMPQGTQSWESMPAVITDVEIPDIDMAAERAKARAAQEEQKAREEQQTQMAHQSQMVHQAQMPQNQTGEVHQHSHRTIGTHNHRH